MTWIDFALRIRDFASAQNIPSKQYPITRSLFVVVKQNGQVEQQAGVAYANFLLSNQGQELIKADLSKFANIKFKGAPNLLILLANKSSYRLD